MSALNIIQSVLDVNFYGMRDAADFLRVIAQENESPSEDASAQRNSRLSWKDFASGHWS